MKVGPGWVQGQVQGGFREDPGAGPERVRGRVQRGSRGGSRESWRIQGSIQRRVQGGSRGIVFFNNAEDSSLRSARGLRWTASCIRPACERGRDGRRVLLRGGTEGDRLRCSRPPLRACLTAIRPRDALSTTNLNNVSGGGSREGPGRIQGRICGGSRWAVGTELVWIHRWKKGHNPRANPA